MKKQPIEYSVTDLSRALIRQYLIQKGMKSTLQAFQKEDSKNKTKINRSLLIEMVSLKNLCILNKLSPQPQSTLLEVLVAYLNKKSQGKKANCINTQPMPQFPTIEMGDEKKNNYEPVKKQETKSRQKQRPQTSKPIRREIAENMQRRFQPLQKQSLKMIYQKLNKVEGALQYKTDVEQLPNSNKQERNAAKRQISSVPLFQTQQVNFQEQYVEVFEEEQTAQKLVNKTLEQGSGWNKKSKRALQSYESIKRQEIPQINQIQIQSTFKNLPSKKDIQEEYLEGPIINKKLYQQQGQFKQETKIQPKPKLQQKLKIVHIQPKPTDLIIEPKVEIEKQANQVQVAVEENQMMEYPKPKRNRSQLRMLNKKQVSLKNIDTVEPDKKAEQEQFVIPNREEKPIIAQLKSEQNVKLIEQINPNKQKPGAKAMMTLGKKRKNKEETSNDANYPTKFKFDQNFKIDIPQEVKYEYQSYNFDAIIISQQTKQLYPWMIVQGGINYKQKGGGVPTQKKRQEKIIASKEAEKLKKIIFQSAPPVFPKSWTQGFILSPFQLTPYGLKQIQGGPCGIIAVLQCYFLKQLLLCSGQNNYSDETLRQVCLVAAITNLLWKVKSTDKITLAIPARGASKVDIATVRVISIEANDFPTAFSGLWPLRDEFIGSSNHGVVSLLLSSVLTRGFEKIEQEMDCKQNPLIGNHGHCTQQFVNMLLTGQAISNVFDGVKLLDDYKLKGIGERSEFGFLTIFQTLKYIEVGKNLKNPIFPAWVICKEFHYHVIFAPHYLISQNHKSEKFDIVYFDGLYNCGDRIRLTVQALKQGEEDDNFKLKDFPLIEQVMMTKWGRRQVSWNGSTKIL